MKFYCATSSGEAHAGIIVAIGSEDELYLRTARLIKQKKAIACDIEGKIAKLPRDFSDVYTHNEIPAMYIVAKDIQYIDDVKRDDTNVTAAVTFDGRVDGKRDIYFTFSHFDPLSNDSLDQCVGWIRDEYVKGRYNGQVLTDFDEDKKHFSDVLFPLNYIMNPKPEQGQVDRLRDLLRTRLGLDVDATEKIISTKYVALYVSHESHDTYNLSGTFNANNMVIGSGTIHANGQLLEKIPNEYANSLKQFSDAINERLKGHQVPKEKVESINSSIDDLANEVEDVRPGKENEVEYAKQVAVESKTASLIQTVLDILPQTADTISTFTPLAPFHTLIGKGVQQIVDAIAARRNRTA